MAVSPRIIKRRIRSIANTRKITKAMELVAGSKMRKSVSLTEASRPYARTIADLVARIRNIVDPRLHSFLSGATEGRSTIVAVASSDRALCGGFNAQILKTSLEFLRTHASDDIRIVTIGRRAEAAIKRAGYPIFASFDAISSAPSYDRVLPIGRLLSTEFTEGRAQRVFLVSMNFQTALVQTPEVRQLLPITPDAELRNSSPEMDEETLSQESSVLFEPRAPDVLEQLLPRLIETQIAQALFETSASEHSARMVAMRSATDNASSMLEDLTFTFNQARQATITREISEISAGKAAV